MSVMDKVLDVLRQTVLIKERIEQLAKAVANFDARQADVRDRVIRIEALIDLGRTARQRLEAWGNTHA